MIGSQSKHNFENVCGDFNIRIDRNGLWYYQGTPITRKSMIKLFSKVLKKDSNGEYWLITPYERGRIEVDDVPYLAEELHNKGHGKSQEINFRTNIDEKIPLGPDYSLWLEFNKYSGVQLPYIETGKGLSARLKRSVFYQLVELGEVREVKGDLCLGVWSRDKFFSLGNI